MTNRSGQGLAYGLAGLLTLTGATHFLRPSVYRPLIPNSLGLPDLWVYGSGVAELCCAALVAAPRTRRLGGWATAGLLVAVFPGNVKMALDAKGRSSPYRAAVLGRLPLQLPLVGWAVAVARRAPAAVPPPCANC